MRACGAVGRVGGLAVALGIGAAVFGGTAPAWADTAAGADSPSVGQSAADGSSGAAARRPHGASRTSVARVENGPAPSRAQVKSRTKPAVAPDPVEIRIAADPVQVPAVPKGVPAISAPVAPSAAISAPVRTEPATPAVRSAAEPTPAPVIAVPAPESAAVSGVVSAVADPMADPQAGGGPAVPAESPLAWTVMAYTRRGSTVAKAAATQPVILGPSGVPIPPDWYVAKVMQLYMPPGANAPDVIFTPEGLYPITGVKSLPLAISVKQGLTILSDTLELLPDATPTTVFGYSQSAIIGSLMQSGYNETPVPSGVADTVNFVFVGNEMNPNGGLLSRFPGLNLPSLGIPFYGATPENAYPTTNYTLEYDGFADFPRYPINLLADINAALGIVYVHTKYTVRSDCTSFCTTQQQVEDAIPLPSTSPTQKYFFMPNENLPLLQPLRGIPIVGNPIADLIQPVLKVIVDLGYADPAHGFTTGVQPLANVQVPFGLFPKVSLQEVLAKLGAGVKQGITDFIKDFGPNGSIAQEISAMKMGAMSGAVGNNVVLKLQNAITGFANWLSTAVSSLYTPLLPTADIVNALLISIPAYDVKLVLNSIKQMISGEPIRGLINAIGLPIASTVGLVTYASLIELLVWGESAIALVPAV